MALGLMKTDDNYVDKWVLEYLVPRRPELVASFLEAREICDRVGRTKSLESGDAERLLGFARSPHTPLGENVASMIGERYAKVPSLGTIIRALAGGRLIHERINALVALSSYPSTDLHSELLAHLLRDKSARIRELAADKIVDHGLTGLHTELEAAVARESNPKVLDALRSDIEYLRCGFLVRRAGEDVWVTCRQPRKGSTSKLFTREEFDAEGSAWIQVMLTNEREA